jgi:ParB-like chromosome segregation protein Spo0J
MTDYPALTPPHTAEEFQRLKRSMARHGQLHPIIKDERGSVLDGAHRLLVCEELDKVALEPLEDVAVVTRRARQLCDSAHSAAQRAEAHRRGSH